MNCSLHIAVFQQFVSDVAGFVFVGDTVWRNVNVEVKVNGGTAISQPAVLWFKGR